MLCAGGADEFATKGGAMDLLKNQLGRLQQHLSSLSASQKMLAATLVAIMAMALALVLRNSSRVRNAVVVIDPTTRRGIDNGFFPIEGSCPLQFMRRPLAICILHPAAVRS
jgi:hypothetical protein